MYAQYTAHMQAFFSARLYREGMADKSKLRQLREAAGFSVRELARQIGESNTNVSYWERSGQIPRSDVLAPLAKILGVTVEELLGESGRTKRPAIKGRLQLVFEAASKLPRRQQEKVAEFVGAFVKQQASGNS